MFDLDRPAVLLSTVFLAEPQVRSFGCCGRRADAGGDGLTTRREARLS
ncbi:hypothetical protein [Zhengella mangrovi]|nr:hypothetical protein [Zhengella mangrovi]